MKKVLNFLLILGALLIGFAVGNRLDLFEKKQSSPPYTYNVTLPADLSDNGGAFSQIVKLVSPSVVNIFTTKTVTREESIPFSHYFDYPFDEMFGGIETPDRWKEQSLGSGVVVSPDGYIITNSHVVEKAEEIRVKLFDKRDFRATLIGSDPKTDIAVIKISAEGLPAIKWGDSDKLEVGEFVLAFGNPYSFGHTVTMGIVSAVGRANVGIADYEDFIQTDAAINPGNSGGPLVNIRGELIGINTAIFSRTGGYQGIGFAVPSNMAKAVMTQLIEKGKVIRGWIGVAIQNFTPELARKFGLDRPRGALITDIYKGGPADRAHLRRGDVIIAVNGKDVENVEHLRNTIAQTSVGTKIRLTIMRDGKKRHISVTIAEMPENLHASVRSEYGGEENTTGDNELYGLTLMNLTPTIAKQLNLSRDERGVVVVRVDPQSGAFEAGLRKGDVIQEINKERITSLDDIKDIKRSIHKGDTLLLFINRGGNKFYITLKIYS